MKIKDLPDLLERRIDYPTDPSTVRSTIGETRIEAPDSSDSRTLSELLGHLEQDTYGSPEELFQAIVSYLPDAYIGRKYYDDRGWSPVEPIAGDDEDQSF